MTLRPLTPPNCDLRDFPYLPIDIVRLFSSDFHFRSSDTAWRAGMTLWLRSFHQVPAASLPDDDAMLARLSEFGRDINGWRAIRDDALHGWIKCEDGRLYHRVVAEKALEAWISKLSRQKGAAKANGKRWGIEIDAASVEEDLRIAVQFKERLARLSLDDRNEIAPASEPDRSATAGGSQVKGREVKGIEDKGDPRERADTPPVPVGGKSDAMSDFEPKPTPKRGRPSKSLVPWPPDFELTAGLREYAQKHGFDADWLFEKFHNKALAVGWQYRDWPAAFRTFAQNERTYTPQGRSNGAHQAQAWRPPDV